jgi:pimeloyl-ACP methyl ester carboxylesterase
MKQNVALRQHCVVYLHGSSSSRLEAFDVLPVLLPAGLSVFCLDFGGSGQSDGEFISLGYHEEQDLREVLLHLRCLDCVINIGIWGRSMGATAAVMRAAEDQCVAACVLDSPFTDLRMAITEYIQNSQIRIPSFAIEAVIQLARTECKSRADFDIFDVAAVKYAEKASCPALFAVAADDSFVLPHHTQELHNKWGGDRQLRFFEGGHNGRRPKWFLDEAAQYLVKKLEEWRLPTDDATDTSLHDEEAHRRSYWL